MNENLEKYLNLMFEDHKEDIKAIKRLDSKRTDIIFRETRKDQKNVWIEDTLKKVLYIGRSSFANIIHKNKKLVIYEK